MVRRRGRRAARDRHRTDRLGEDADRLASASLLAELGFWRGLDDGAAGSAVRDVARGASPLATDLPGTRVWADGEDLAEGDVERWLGEDVAPLVADWVSFDVATVAEPGTGAYVVRVAGEEVRCDGPEDWAARDERFPWYAATVRPLAAVDRLLVAADAPVRWFTLAAGGNDGAGLLVAPAAVAVLARLDRGSEPLEPVG